MMISRPAKRFILSRLAPAFLFVMSCQAWAASGPAEQFQQWSGDTWVNRQFSFSTLGFNAPMVLSGSDSQREVYLPVPVGVAIQDAAVQVNAKYMRADGGRSTLVLSADGVPLAAHRYTDDQGDASQKLAITGNGRKSGFVRLGIGWSSVISDLLCADQRAPGNSLQLAPDSVFSYRFDRSAIQTLSAAWSALPASPVLLLPGKKLSPAAFDTAWRLGVTLEHMGKRVRMAGLPEVGESIDLSGVSVPDSLRGIPAFAALAAGTGMHRLASKAEVGALLALGHAGPLGADLLVDDPGMRGALKQAFDALGEQLAGSGAAEAFAAWRKADGMPFDVAASKDQVRLATLAGNLVIVVDQSAGSKAAGLFGSFWRAMAQGRSLTVANATAPTGKTSAVLLSQVGAVSGTLNIVSRGERVASFDLGSVARDGRLPSQVVLDVSAAPNAGGDSPVLSVLLNDYLIGAEKLPIDGKIHRVEVNIPRYALAARNEIRVEFLRQPTQIRCHDQPTAYPVSILPSSHLLLSKASSRDDFVGAALSLANGYEVFMPSSWLGDAPAKLTSMVRLGAAVGASGTDGTLKPVSQGQNAEPQQGFLAFDVPVTSSDNGVKVENGRLVLNQEGGAPLLDVTGLQRLTVAEVLTASSNKGVLFKTVGSAMPETVEPFLLSRGNLAVVSKDGPILEIDTHDPGNAQLAEEGNPQSLWEQHMWLWLGIIGVIVFMLLAARVAQVRRQRRDRNQAES